jgi:hypothetical protein
MGAQNSAVGKSTYTPFTFEAAGTVYASRFTPSAYYSGASVTGAINSSLKPILVTGVSIVFVSGGGSARFSTSSNPNSFANPETAFADTQYYYGFAKNSGTVTFRRGDGRNPNGIYENGTSINPDTESSATWPETSIAGTISWSHAPSAPAITSATISEANASVTLSWSAPSDSGGKTVNGYRVLYKQRNTSTDLTASSWTVLTTGSTNGANISKGVVAGTTAVISGLIPGAVYDFRVAALNEVTHRHNGGTASVVGTYTSPSAHTGTNAARNSVTLAGAPRFIADNIPTFAVFGQTYVGGAEARFPTPELINVNFTYTVATVSSPPLSGTTAGLPAGTTLSSAAGLAAITGVLTDTTAKTYCFALKATDSSSGASVTSDPFIVRVQNSRLQSRDSGTFARRNTRVRVGTAWLVAGVRVYDPTYTAPWDGGHWRPLE